MARIEVVMPQMGESIAEGTIVKWHKKVGDQVRKDETLLEISTDKVDSEIPSPASGVLAQILVAEQATVPVKTVIALIEAEGAAQDEAPRAAAPAAAAPAQSPPPPVVPGSPARAAASGPPKPGRFYSPLVLSIARAEGIGMEELERIPGTGEGGRVSKKDILTYLKTRTPGAAAVTRAPQAVAPAPTPASVGRPVDAPELRSKYPAPDYEIIQMSNVLQKMSQHMLHSVQVSPHVEAIHEVDMTSVVKHRAMHAAEFERREGFKLTFTPYVAEAVVLALKKYPLVNSSVEGDKIIKKNFTNLGLAVASDNGLIVPVIKHAEELNFLGLARGVYDLAARTREKRLKPDDIQGGTFTISNFGVFGTLIGTPIINQPQVAILGTGAITKRVAVIEDALAIRSMAFFTLSFDHRIIDGALGGMFLNEIIRHLQEFDPERKL